jgi:hypothetical protein
VVVDQLREKLIKIGAKVVSHGRYVTSSQFRRPALINILWLAGAKKCASKNVREYLVTGDAIVTNMLFSVIRGITETLLRHTESNQVSNSGLECNFSAMDQLDSFDRRRLWRRSNIASMRSSLRSS